MNSVGHHLLELQPLFYLGSRSDREGFQRLMSDAETGTFKTILCWDQDRFSRQIIIGIFSTWPAYTSRPLLKAG